MLNKKLKTIVFLIGVLFFTTTQAANPHIDYTDNEECSTTAPCESEVVDATSSTVTVEVMVTSTQLRQYVLRRDEFVMLKHVVVGDYVFIILDYDYNVLVAKLTK